MPERNQYDTLVIYSEIKKDIQKQKRMIWLSGFLFFILLMVVIPLAFWLFFGLLSFADLPFFDQGFIGMFRHTKLFLLPYTFLLVFYFITMYLKDRKLHLKNKKHYKKAVIFFAITLFIVVLPYIFTNNVLLTMLFFLFFIMTVYYLSMTYYDVELQKAYNIHDHPYVLEDFGWMTSMGMVDSPTTIRDDMNRAKIFVQASTLGFDFIATFIDLIVKSVLFIFAVKDKHYVQEAARLFHVILEAKPDDKYDTFSVQSKVILELLNYVSFMNGNILLYKRGEEVKKSAIQKEQK